MTQINPPAPLSRLKRERRLARSRKEAAMEAYVVEGLKKTGPVNLPFDATSAESLIDATHFIARAADFLDDLSVVGPMQPNQVKLRDIPEDESPDKKAIIARAERKIMMANLAATIDFVLDCPGENIQICDGLWRLYEGLQYVEQTGKCFHAFEPSADKNSAVVALDKHVTRKAGVAAAQWAYMLSGLSEDQAAEKVMAWVTQTTPSHFGLPAHKEWGLETVKNWRRTLNKGQTESASVLVRYNKWKTQLQAWKKSRPKHLTVWAERMLFLTVHRLFPGLQSAD